MSRGGWVAVVGFALAIVGCMSTQEGGAGGAPTTTTSVVMTTSTHGSGGSATTSTTTTSNSCGLATVCPAGDFTACEPGDTTITCCDPARGITVACARPAGILVRNTAECAAICKPAECAVAKNGTLTCCQWSVTTESAGACDEVDGGF